MAQAPEDPIVVEVVLLVVEAVLVPVIEPWLPLPELVVDTPLLVEPLPLAETPLPLVLLPLLESESLPEPAAPSRSAKHTFETQASPALQVPLA
jgi:hypothetical protein